MGNEKEVLDISTKDLKAAAPTFESQSGALLKATMTLQAKLSSAGEPWGNDNEKVRQWADSYEQSQMSIENAVTILISGLASIHAAMTDMSDGHVDNEDAIRGMFNKQETPDWLPSQRQWHPPMAAPQAPKGPGPTG